MDQLEDLSVALTPEMVAELRAAVAQGHYDSVSDVVREAIDAWRVTRQQRDADAAEFRKLVRDGIDSGPALDADEIFDRLRAKFGDPPPA